ncbi:MAG TPA: tripartite tricarboxylate transporter substrate binding protein [Xanthobacteraceae bacterium]|nr:tripartite tricarboxylate transporter substrate binding protein [Xanthobacteraceae bacterium]
MRTLQALLCIGLAVCALAMPAAAADYACGKIRLIVPYGVGGATDIGARAVADRLSAALNKTIVIENHAGATGNIGTLDVVKAPADGCTLLMNATAIATFTASFPHLPYDPFKDLAPIGGLGATPNVLVSAASSPAHGLNDLIALAKSRPAGLTFATSGYGLQQHLVVEQIAQRTGAKFILVPYKVAATMVEDVVAGRIDFGSLLAGTTKPLIESHQLRAQVLVQDARSNLLPDVPTTGELGYPGLLGSVHFVLFAPSATPKPIVDLLDATLRKVVAEPGIGEKFRRIGFEPTPMTSAQIAGEMVTMRAAFAPIIKSLNIHLE